MSNELILALNPRMEFTRIAVFKMNSPIFLKKILHCEEELKEFKYFTDQANYRAKIVLEELKANDIETENIKIVLGRGGLIKPVKSGAYLVNKKLEDDLKDPELGSDVVNLGGLIASEIAGMLPDSRPFIVAPVVVDELEEIARYTGRPELKKRSIFHALNHKTVARRYAKSVYKEYEDLNLIIAHLGGGISVGAHYKGRVIDTNQAFDGDGPFSPIRSGSLPVGDVIKMCYSGKYSRDEMLKMQTGEGGLYAYFKTFSGYDVCKMRDNGHEEAGKVLEAMAYQVAKTIGSMFPVFKSEPVDAIILTGGMAKDAAIVQMIRERVDKIAPVVIYPGADVLNSLGLYGTMILRNDIEILEYK